MVFFLLVSTSFVGVSNQIEKVTRGTLLLSTSNGNWLYVGGSGFGNYTRIQVAIDNASDGDTVFVYDDSSPYIENIIINKSISLVGENTYTTIIDGNNSGDVVTVSAEYVKIQRFTITNCDEWYGSGIRVYSDDIVIDQNRFVINNVGISLNNTQNCTIRNCSFFNFYGPAMVLKNTGNNSIYDNTINTCPYGILLYGSHENVIMRNTFQNCFDAVEFSYSTFNILDNNVISYMSWYAVLLWKNSEHNTISNNTISNNDDVGIHTQDSNYITIVGNSIVDNKRAGISVFNCSFLLCQSNYIENNGDIGGIHISRTNNGTIISNNIIKDNRYGIYTDASDLQIIENTIINSDIIGLRVYDTNNNIILRNNFIGNEINAESVSGDNIWDDGVYGNYWDDYKGKDINGDSIGDTPYIIEDDYHQDNSPLMVPYGSNPSVRITQPEEGFIYIRNLRLFSSSSTILFGTIKIEVSAANYVHGIDHVDFYIDDVLRKTDTSSPYEWTWRLSSHLKHRHILRVIAFDTKENSTSAEIQVWKFF